MSRRRRRRYEVTTIALSGPAALAYLTQRRAARRRRWTIVAVVLAVLWLAGSCLGDPPAPGPMTDRYGAVSAPVTLVPAPLPSTPAPLAVDPPAALSAPAENAAEPSAFYGSCAAARAAGAAPLTVGEPGYRGALDADGDGVACERDS